MLRALDKWLQVRMLREGRAICLHDIHEPQGFRELFGVPIVDFGVEDGLAAVRRHFGGGDAGHADQRPAVELAVAAGWRWHGLGGQQARQDGCGHHLQRHGNW